MAVARAAMTSRCAPRASCVSSASAAILTVSIPLSPRRHTSATWGLLWSTTEIDGPVPDVAGAVVQLGRSDDVPLLAAELGVRPEAHARRALGDDQARHVDLHLASRLCARGALRDGCHTDRRLRARVRLVDDVAAGVRGAPHCPERGFAPTPALVRAHQGSTGSLNHGKGLRPPSVAT